MKKLTTTEAIIRIQKKHPTLNCSRVTYKGAHLPVTMICDKHNHVFNVPYAYLIGDRCKYGCVHCQSESYRLDKLEVINRFKNTHGAKYDYSKVVYKNNLDKVEIICPKHGSFMQEPAAHWKGHGCVKCAIENGRHGPGGYNTETLKYSKETGIIYVLKINRENTYYKIGISKISGQKRIKDISYVKKAEVLYESEKILLRDAYKIEQEMLNLYRRYRYPDKKISGWTEIISELPDIKLLKQKINELNYANI